MHRRDDRDRVLFVRHTYGDRTPWEMPGGGLRRGEAPEAAVRREMREELGIELVELREAVPRSRCAGTTSARSCTASRRRPAAPPMRLAAAEIAAGAVGAGGRAAAAAGPRRGDPLDRFAG